MIKYFFIPLLFNMLYIKSIQSWTSRCSRYFENVFLSSCTTDPGSSPIPPSVPIPGLLARSNTTCRNQTRSNVTVCAQVQCGNLERHVKLCEGKHWLWSIRCVGRRGGGSEPLPAAAKIFIRLPESMSANSYTWSRRKKWEGGGEERGGSEAGGGEIGEMSDAPCVHVS